MDCTFSLSYMASFICESGSFLLFLPSFFVRPFFFIFPGFWFLPVFWPSPERCFHFALVWFLCTLFRSFAIWLFMAWHGFLFSGCGLSVIRSVAWETGVLWFSCLFAYGFVFSDGFSVPCFARRVFRFFRFWLAVECHVAFLFFSWPKSDIYFLYFSRVAFWQLAAVLGSGGPAAHRTRRNIRWMLWRASPQGRSKGPEPRSGEWVEEPYFGSGSRVGYADHITFFRDVLRPLILFSPFSTQRPLGSGCGSCSFHKWAFLIFPNGAFTARNIFPKFPIWKNGLDSAHLWTR